MRGRKPKPTHLKLVEGNPGKRPLNLNEPRSGALGPPPSCLTAAERAAWRELVRAAPANVLQASDRFVVELAARLLVRMRATAEVSNTTATVLKAVLSEIGMTPSSRTRLSVPLPATNPFEDL